MHLRRARVPIELLIGTPSEAAYESEDTYVTAASKRMRQAYSLVREQLRACFDRAKKRYDERVKTTRFAVGDFVWHFIPHRSKGLNRKWLLGNKGPYRITRKINDVNFVVKRTPKSDEVIVHIDRLTKHKNAVPSQWKNEIEREKREADGLQEESDRINEPPTKRLKQVPKEPRAEMHERQGETVGGLGNPSGLVGPEDEHPPTVEQTENVGNVRSDDESDTWEQRDQLTSFPESQLTSHVLGRKRVTQRKEVDASEGVTTETSR